MLFLTLSPIVQKYSFFLCSLFCLRSVLRIIRAISCESSMRVFLSLGICILQGIYYKSLIILVLISITE